MTRYVVNFTIDQRTKAYFRCQMSHFRSMNIVCPEPHPQKVKET